MVGEIRGTLLLLLLLILLLLQPLVVFQRGKLEIVLCLPMGYLGLV